MPPNDGTSSAAWPRWGDETPGRQLFADQVVDRRTNRLVDVHNEPFLQDERCQTITHLENQMTLLNRILTAALGLFLISAGVAKFTTGHVFQYIEHTSGIDLFYPFVNNLTGIAEILAGAAILYRPTRLVGAAVAVALMVGAIGFHVSPWLGTSIPTGLVEGASSPWDAADFATTTSSTSFVLAIVSAVRASSIVRRELRARRTAKTADAPTRSAGVLVGT